MTMYWFIDACGHTVTYHLSKLKSYRRYKGGTWYRVFPKPFPYMSYWTNRKLDNEVAIEEEYYGRGKR
jgi:hypothetical protein